METHSVTDTAQSEREKPPSLSEAIREQTVGYFITALGLIAGLAWNDAIQALINHLLPAAKNSVIAKIVYALFITVLVATLAFQLKKHARRQ